MMNLIVTCVIAALAMNAAISSVNQMDKRTPLAARLAYIVVGVTALGVLISPFFNRPPLTWTEAACMLACMMLMRAHTYQSFCEIAPHAQSSPR